MKSNFSVNGFLSCQLHLILIVLFVQIYLHTWKAEWWRRWDTHTHRKGERRDLSVTTSANHSKCLQHQGLTPTKPGSKNSIQGSHVVARAHLCASQEHWQELEVGLHLNTPIFNVSDSSFRLIQHPHAFPRGQGFFFNNLTGFRQFGQ